MSGEPNKISVTLLSEISQLYLIVSLCACTQSVGQLFSAYIVLREFTQSVGQLFHLYTIHSEFENVTIFSLFLPCIFTNIFGAIHTSIMVNSLTHYYLVSP